MINRLAAIAACTATQAAAAPALLTVETANSPFDLTACVAPDGFPQNCDTVTGNIVGTLELKRIDANTAGNSLILIDFAFGVSEPIAFVFDYSFLGSITVTIDALTFSYDGAEPLAPIPLTPDGIFLATAVPVRALGSGSVSGSGLVGGLVTPGPVDIDTASPADLAGTLTGPDNALVLSSSLMISEALDVDGVSVTLDGTANLIASGQEGCPADVNGDGDASPADFTAWLGAFNNPADINRIRADVNCDGSLTPADFTAWLAAFNIGCN